MADDYDAHPWLVACDTRSCPECLEENRADAAAVVQRMAEGARRFDIEWPRGAAWYVA